MRAKKSLGQHFLVSQTAIGRILAACQEESPHAAGVLEIGPGRGALTAGLADLGKPFWALEADLALTLELQERYPGACVILADAAELDLADFSRKARTSPWLVAGNLPYNVGTAVARRVLASPRNVVVAVLMLQKEVAQKFCATRGRDGYGPIAAWAGPWWEREILFTLGPGAFRPQPKVTSAVCLFRPKRHPLLSAGEIGPYAAFLARAFAHPRKLLAANLAGEGRDARFCKGTLESLGLSDKVRPAQASPADYVRLFQRSRPQNPAAE